MGTPKGKGSNEKLLKVCQVLNLAPAEIARSIGISENTVKAWFYRDALPGGDKALKMIAFLKEKARVAGHHYLDYTLDHLWE